MVDGGSLGDHLTSWDALVEPTVPFYEVRKVLEDMVSCFFNPCKFHPAVISRTYDGLSLMVTVLWIVDMSGLYRRKVGLV